MNRVNSQLAQSTVIQQLTQSVSQSVDIVNMVKTEHLDPSYSFYPINSFAINISLPNEKFFAAGGKFERGFYREWTSLGFEFL